MLVMTTFTSIIMYTLHNCTFFRIAGFKSPGIIPTNTGEMVRGGYQESGEKSVAPRISAMAPVNPPANGPSKSPARIIGILPKLILTLSVSHTTKNRDKIMLIDAKSAIRTKVFVLSFFIKKSSCP
jgi:hypothetical protein